MPGLRVRERPRAAAEAARAQVGVRRAPRSIAPGRPPTRRRGASRRRARSRRAPTTCSPRPPSCRRSTASSRRLRVREGEMVVVGIQNQPGTTLMTISDLGAINAEVKVAEADVLRVVVGQRGRGHARGAARQTAFRARSSRSARARCRSSGTGAAGARVQGRRAARPAGPRPAARADLRRRNRDRASARTSSPCRCRASCSAAAPPGGERPGVFVVADGQARFTPVVLGRDRRARHRGRAGSPRARGSSSARTRCCAT